MPRPLPRRAAENCDGQIGSWSHSRQLIAISPAGTREVYAATARMVSTVPRRMTAAVRHDQFLPVSPRLPGETCCHTDPVWQNILLFAVQNRTIYRKVFPIAGFSLAIFPIPPLHVRLQ